MCADAGAGLRDQREELAAVSKFHILVAEIELELEEGGEVDKLPAQLFQLFGIAPAQLADGKAVGGGIGGVDKVGHGLCLAEVEPTAEEGLAGEFARLGQPGTAVDE